MERKNYLVEKLSKEEKGYIMKVALNTRRKFVRDNYEFINSQNIEISQINDIEAESILDAVINKCENEIKSAIEFENVITDNNLYNVVKALSLKEKIVLFSLYKEKKTIKQIAIEMKISRKRVWEIKSKAQDKILKYLIGGEKNV